MCPLIPPASVRAVVPDAPYLCCARGRTRVLTFSEPSRFLLPLVLPFLLLLPGILLTGPAAHLAAQLIPVKTVPVAAGDQFLLFPSTNLGMGGVTLALSDTLGDPFVNPATGSRLSENLFFSSPVFYHVSGGNGSGRTLPVGTLFRSGDWFGGGAVSLQELEGANRNRWFPRPLGIWSAQPQILSEQSARNLYALGIFGRRFPESGISVGVSAFWADLGAVDGVDLLYALSEEIQQSGHFSDVRLGLTKEWPGERSLELLLLRTKLRMKHDVSYLDLVWTPGAPGTEPLPVWVTRIEENFDHTDTWGGQIAYRRPLNADGWKIGWSLTGNWKDHPKIPNYEIQNIPRDPGNTWAYGLGVGISKVQESSRFGVELVLEPIRSETWAEAISDTVSITGDKIEAGEKTVENEFRFTDAVLRAGGALDYKRATFRAGIQVRSFSYELDQFNRIEALRRDQDESWMEWSPSAGVSLNLKGAGIHYAARMTTGTGRPGVEWIGQRGAVLDLASSVDFILAPSGPLTLQDAEVITHQLSVVLPFR